jgi:DNA polymerase V
MYSFNQRPPTALALSPAVSILATIPAAIPAAILTFPLVSSQSLLGCLVGSVRAGFPSPAEDHAGQRIDLFDRLNSHPQATFFMKVSGLSMTDAGISEGDVIVVDRSIKPKNGHIVVAVVDGEFTVKQLVMRAGVVKLRAANPTFKDIVLKEGQDLQVWGVVKAALKEFRT